MADPTRRSAALWATAVALPVAILVIFLSLWVLGGLERARSVPASPPMAATTPVPTAPVPVATHTLAPEAATVCRAVVAGLPSSIPAGPSRPVVGGADQAAAYGDPPVVLRCGTAMPSPPPTAVLAVLNGVCWYAEPAGSTTTLTTMDRIVPVSVSVPGPVDGSAQSVMPFATAIARADPRRPDPPSGCS
jgi:hypothetical protein